MKCNVIKLQGKEVTYANMLSNDDKISVTKKGHSLKKQQPTSK